MNLSDLLMTECKVTRTAEIMSLSQSAMSHILNRLRTALDDPLLIRTEDGIKPTAYAICMSAATRSDGCVAKFSQ